MQAVLDPLSRDLLDRVEAVRAEQPKIRARDLAARLGITEAELVALNESGTVRRLRPDFAEILGALHTLGPIMALTRNEYAVHEKTGVYEPVSINGPTGLVLGEAIDLRLFLGRWRFVFAVAEGGRRSLQFFDRHGMAMHKVYLTEASDEEALDHLVARFATVPAPLDIDPPTADPTAEPDETIDVPAFHQAWDGLKDTHEFHGLLNKFKLQRVQALRLAGPDRARPVSEGALRSLLTAAAETQVPIMVFVGNPGIIQIHTGPIERLLPTGPWFNILDPGFNLHLREDAIASAWIVEKPTVDGPVTALELFDAEAKSIATLFGKRKPGKPEDPNWRALLDAIPISSNEIAA